MPKETNINNNAYMTYNVMYTVALTPKISFLSKSFVHNIVLESNAFYVVFVHYCA